MPRGSARSSRTRWRRPTDGRPSSRRNSGRLKAFPQRAHGDSRFMEAIRFIVDTLLWLLTLAFMLRLLFQWVRADFRDPVADAIVRVTNWLIMPLRRLLPPMGKVDTATVVAVGAIASAR